MAKRWEIRSSLAVTAMALVGCRPQDGEEIGLLQGILWEYLLPLVGQTLLWTTLGGLALASVAILGYWLSRRLGWYEGGGWVAFFRTLTAWLLVILGAGLGAAAGFGEGLYRAERQILATGVLARSVFPAVGSAGADQMAGLVWASEVDAKIVLDSTAKTQLATRLEDFRQGRWQLPAEKAFGHLDRLERATIDHVVDPVRAQAEEQFPAVADGLGRQILDFTLRKLTELALSEALEEGLEATPVGDSAALLANPARMVQALRETARQQNGLLSHQQIADAIVEWLVVKPLIQALRPLVRANQIAAVLVLLGALLAAPVPFALVAAIRRRLGKNPAPPTPTESTSLEPKP